MPNNNPFPESAEKDFLRQYHLLYTLADHQESIGRPLAYFGLPSAEMFDVALWKPLLGHITAIERDESVALQMYRVAQRLGIRQKTIVIEMALDEITKLLAMDEKDVQLSLVQLHSSVQDKINRVRHIVHDVINLDLCGGFLYHGKRSESENAKILRHLINFQAKQGSPFILIVTFALRDTGKDDYNSFIKETLDHLDHININTSEIREYYLAKEIPSQPINLRRLRFCFPTYIHKIAFDHFQVSSLGAWYYKTFYHSALSFEPRKGKSVLGKSWPPLDEFKDLLRASMTRLETDEQGKLIRLNLPAPALK